MTLIWAKELNRNQRHKGNQVFYVGHLIEVSTIACADGGPEEQAITCPPHNAIEEERSEAAMWAPGLAERQN